MSSNISEDPNDLSLQERAWCPDAKVGKELREFMEIDLGRQSIIKLIITKGRVAQSKVSFIFIKLVNEPLNKNITKLEFFILLVAMKFNYF